MGPDNLRSFPFSQGRLASAISIEVEGLAELLESIDARLARLEEKVDALSTGGGGWYSTKGAARYLDKSEIAIRSLVAADKIKVARDVGGRLMFMREWLDECAQAGGNGR